MTIDLTARTSLRLCVVCVCVCVWCEPESPSVYRGQRSAEVSMRLHLNVYRNHKTNMNTDIQSCTLPELDAHTLQILAAQIQNKSSTQWANVGCVFKKKNPKGTNMKV